MEPPREDLTAYQWRTKYETLEAEHAQLKQAKADGEAKAAQALSDLKVKHGALEAEHARFKTIHAANPHIRTEAFSYFAQFGLYKMKGELRSPYYCGACLAKGIAAPMQKLNDGFSCVVCEFGTDHMGYRL